MIRACALEEIRDSLDAVVRLDHESLVGSNVDFLSVLGSFNSSISRERSRRNLGMSRDRIE
ncbi:MAG: hypothetical protein A2722_04000 [Candidatus Doudnabacteria bacterium RIFCSPHIGHO2_01_FULL_50_11]|uniref:Uncharacterized protein n=1 Tax=Candidatus Doudnabacteria bacterium RIFCSPHIGHO2_01_FULL_50_11 TaxID=1817828 RepID=A0A1F5PMM9_9BACT|nr:MAG: hypothetical protein A2722_04000 [Candidatus Doudnabacteria bacterium RIFCSPHIGHO2_01_FULL_50_11]HLC44273.1 hypothetical protein [Patescibacteria group bacterium]